MTTVKDQVKSKIKEQTEPTPDDGENTQNIQASVWTSASRISKKLSRQEDIDRDHVRNVIEELDEEGEVIRWFGLLTLAEEDYLNTIIKNESNSKFPRTILIGQCNQLK